MFENTAREHGAINFFHAHDTTVLRADLLEPVRTAETAKAVTLSETDDLVRRSILAKNTANHCKGSNDLNADICAF